MSVFLLRHGETRWAINGRHTGLTNIPLTNNGVWQAINAGERLRRIHPEPFRDAYVSPLERAIDTFQYADVPADDLHVDYRIHEWDYGYAEGLSTCSINNLLGAHQDAWRIWDDNAQSRLESNGISYASDVDMDNDTLVSPPHIGESAHDVYDRALTFIQSIDTEHDVLIVAHSHIIRFLAAAWVCNPSIAGVLNIEPAKIEVLTEHHGNREITAWGL